MSIPVNQQCCRNCSHRIEHKPKLENFCHCNLISIPETYVYTLSDDDNDCVNWNERITVMITGVTVSQPVSYTDERGWLYELFRADSTPTSILPAMAYVSCTKPGVSRGPHEHLTQTDTFVFLSGYWYIKLWDNRPDSQTYKTVMRAKIKPGTIVVVPPGVVHAYGNANALKSGLVLNLPNVLYRGFGKLDKPDEIRHETNKDFPVNDIQNQHWIRKWLQKD